MGGGNLNNKGFAISGVLYPVLILALFLIIQILFMMQSRKTVLDRNKKELIETINTENKVYTNEELSMLINQQNKTIIDLTNQLMKNKEETDGKITSLEKRFISSKKEYFASTLVTGNNFRNINLKLKNFKQGPVMVNVKIIGQYAWVCFGGNIEYNFSAFVSGEPNSTLTYHGLGEEYKEAGALGNFIDSVSLSGTAVSTTIFNANMKINFNTAASGGNGSNIYAYVTIYNGYGNVNDEATVVFE